jgi:hypothetical protein
MTPHDHWNFLKGTSFLFSFCFSASFDAFWVGGRVHQVYYFYISKVCKEIFTGYTILDLHVGKQRNDSQR